MIGENNLGFVRFLKSRSWFAPTFQPSDHAKISAEAKIETGNLFTMPLSRKIALNRIKLQKSEKNFQKSGAIAQNPEILSNSLQASGFGNKLKAI